MNNKEYHDLLKNLKRGSWILLIEIIFSIILVSIIVYKN